ncbi:Crp/Fnr family transcriptional regulator [Nocardiopsis sp. N85]|uniref:Crp/Fnr family transcriptional regulator n=1 Tax=Nocardiopsis sp. N85 TaxID=3029400 RepID=UPI00237EEB8A|nr:Crp/Fnr family transcriptional regulator [Nocardiopsis sp. N85]MDE3721991.1 Crp/Fnr family transcriptional regulator [Nocardiopsis sp. N85]
MTPDEGPSEFWAGLTEQERADLRRTGTVRRWSRREILFHEGAASDLVIVVTTGRIKVSSHTAGGSEAVLAVRGPGTLVGELGVIDGSPRSATVQALDDLTALTFTPERFEAYLERWPRVSLLLLRMVVSRLRDADRKRVEFGALDAGRRVASRLVEMADRFGRDSGEGVRVDLPVSQDELASWTGVSRAAVNKSLALLRARGWISTGRMNVTLHDVPALRAYAEDA